MPRPGQGRYHVRHAGCLAPVIAHWRHCIMSFPPIARASAVIVLITFAAGQQASAQGRGRGNDEHPAPPPVSQQEQQRRIAEEQSRQQQYRTRLDAQIRAAQAQQAQLQAAHHAAQLAQQQRYIAELQRQREEVQAQRDYAHEAYITTPLNYRYRYNGVVRQTNQYGADLLRQAVSEGYQQGYGQGQADRQDGAGSNYRRAFAYQDANAGYTGAYVPQSDYNYYFREGFRRGYQDGYAS